MNPRFRFAVAGVVLMSIAVSACQPSLEGTWSGYYSSGDAVSLTFGPDNSLTVVSARGDTVTPPEGGTIRYDVLNEVYPNRQFLVLAMGDTLQRQLPIGIYKIENGRLVICDPNASQPTIMGLPVGEPSYEWPTDFTGNCYGLDRS